MESKNPNTLDGLILSGTMLLVNFTMSLFLHNYLDIVMVAGLRARTILNAIVYRKVCNNFIPFLLNNQHYFPFCITIQLK